MSDLGKGSKGIEEGRKSNTEKGKQVAEGSRRRFELRESDKARSRERDDEEIEGGRREVSM